MKCYTPDSWKIVKITSEQYGEIFKVLCSWQGGYTDADVWKLSSGFVDLKELENKYETNQASGSLYILMKNNERESSFMREKFNNFKSSLSAVSATIEYVDMKDFLKIFNPK